MENEKNIDEKLQGSLFLPSKMPEIHATGAAIAYNPFNFRLLLVNEELCKNDDFSIDGVVKTFNSAVGEIILHPQVAKQISILLTEKIKNYESEYGKLSED